MIIEIKCKNLNAADKLEKALLETTEDLLIHIKSPRNNDWYVVIEPDMEVKSHD